MEIKILSRSISILILGKYTGQCSAPHYSISAMVNGTVLNFGKRYEYDLRVIFDQWQKLHLGLDVLRNQKNLKMYLMSSSKTKLPQTCIGL